MYRATSSLFAVSETYYASAFEDKREEFDANFCRYAL